MFNNIRLGKVLGTEIFLHWSWFLLLLFWVDFTSANEIMWDVFTLVTVFGFVLIHEFGHIQAARKYGVDTPKITLSLLGGAAHIDKGMDSLKPKQQLWVVFAGPLTNIILALIFIPIVYFAFYNFNFETSGVMARMTNSQEYVITCLVINISMFIFNMLPIYPMDGGRLLRSTLEHFNVKRAQFISIRVTQVTSILLLIWAISVIAIVGIIISIAFFAMAWMELRNLKQEIIEYELSKALEDSYVDGMPNSELLNMKISQVRQYIADGSLWKRTDYVKKYEKDEYSSTEYN